MKTEETHEELIAARAEIKHWRLVAAYLAECHAATLEMLPNKAPSSARRRFAEICRKSALYLARLESPPFYERLEEQGIPQAIERCQRAVFKYAKRKPETEESP